MNTFLLVIIHTYRKLPQKYDKNTSHDKSEKIQSGNCWIPKLIEGGYNLESTRHKGFSDLIVFKHCIIIQTNYFNIRLPFASLWIYSNILFLFSFYIITRVSLLADRHSLARIQRAEARIKCKLLHQ